MKDQIDKQIIKEQKKNNMLLIDKYVELFNKDNENLILDFNYEILNENDGNYEGNMIILFKHIFRNFKETQKYITCNIKMHTDSVVITYKTLTLALDIPKKAELLPITSAKFEYKMNGDKCDNVVTIVTSKSSDELANFNMVVKLFEICVQKSLDKPLLFV